MPGRLLGGLVVFAAAVAVGIAAGALPAAAGGRGADPLEQWGGWRGPLASGVAPEGDPPVEWSERRHVRWKTPLPGRGHGSPVVWGDRVLVTSAVEVGEPLTAPEHGGHDSHGAHDNAPPAHEMDFVVLALDRRNGSVAWRRVATRQRPHESAHVTGGWASASPVTDGRRVVASFGSRGLFAYRMDGKPLWSRDLGDMTTLHGHGEGSSPVLHGDTLVVNWDHEGESFLVVLDARTGETRWRVARDEVTSWSTPLIVEHEGRHQVVVSATRRIRGYDLASGEEIWSCGGLSRNVVASPVAAGGMVYAANSYDRRALLAIRLAAARGDITGSDAVAWSRDRDTPYVPSPVLDGGRLCFLKHNQPVLTCVDAATGETLHGPRRLEGIRHVFASPVAAAGRLYVADRDGATAVLRLGGDWQRLALNHLDDSFSASPAIAGDELFLRGERHLYCLAAGGE